MKMSTVLRRMRKSPMFMIGSILLIIVIVLCATSSFWVQWDSANSNLADRLLPPDWFANGLKGHPFGTDPLGRDVLTRLHP